MCGVFCCCCCCCCCGRWFYHQRYPTRGTSVLARGAPTAKARENQNSQTGGRRRGWKIGPKERNQKPKTKKNNHPSDAEWEKHPSETFAPKANNLRWGCVSRYWNFCSGCASITTTKPLNRSFAKWSLPCEGKALGGDGEPVFVSIGWDALTRDGVKLKRQCVLRHEWSGNVGQDWASCERKYVRVLDV